MRHCAARISSCAALKHAAQLDRFEGQTHHVPESASARALMACSLGFDTAEAFCRTGWAMYAPGGGDLR
jgi:hypothetical protein